MISASRIEGRLQSFTAWLSMAGAELMVPTSEWEVIRFRDGSITSIIYKGKKGFATFTGTSLDAWQAYRTGQQWRASIPKTKRENRKARDASMVTIRKRDGDCCFFCGGQVPEDEESVEHLVDITYGGPNHISNKFLAHISCNNEAVGLSAPEKIARYHAARSGVEHVRKQTVTKVARPEPHGLATRIDPSDCPWDL